ncbi:YjfI family protein [Flavobacteriaceae bacterium]|nr:YjfI family protein [Flavobacteriaceae bacterium]
MTNIKDLADKLIKIGEDEKSNFSFQINPIPGEVEVLQILIEDREELPIFISLSLEQILCISYIFKENEIKENLLPQLHESMLIANTPMPLSAFAKIDDQYVIYGAMSINSSIDDIIHEIETLSDNTIDAIETMSDYLK